MKTRCVLLLTIFLAWAGSGQAREPQFVDFRNQAKREVEIAAFDAYTKQAVSGAYVQFSFRERISFIRPLAIAEWQSTKIQKDSAQTQDDGKAAITYKGIKDSFAVGQITAEGYRNCTGPFPTLRENRKATIKVF